MALGGASGPCCLQMDQKVSVFQELRFDEKRSKSFLGVLQGTMALHRYLVSAVRYSNASLNYGPLWVGLERNT